MLELQNVASWSSDDLAFSRFVTFPAAATDFSGLNRKGDILNIGGSGKVSLLEDEL